MNVLDPETIASLKALDDGDGFFAEIVQTFLSNARPTLERLRQAERVNDLGELERAAHKLRGSASTVGAQSLMALSGRLEQAVRQGRLPTSIALEIELIEAEFNRVVAALNAEMGA